MFVGYTFRIRRHAEERVSPMLGTEDIDRLEKIFPGNPIWEARTTGVGNIYHPTPDQAAAFLAALKSYATAHALSGDEYITGNTTGGGPYITSNIKGVFEDLIRFFEENLP